MQFSPRLDARLIEVVRTAEVERMSVAETWRLVGETAERLSLCRPGYHSVLRLVLEERDRRAARRAAITDAVSEVWSYTGIDYQALARRLAETRRS